MPLKAELINVDPAGAFGFDVVFVLLDIPLIYNIFDLNTSHININVFENIKIANGPIIKETIKTILKTDGFLFSEKSS